MRIFNLSYHRNATTSFHDYMEKYKIKSFHNVSKIFAKLTGTANNFLTPEDWLETSYTAEKFVEKYSNELVKYIKESDYTSFSDNPFPLFYKILAEEFPDAKFILFKRDAMCWLNSVTCYFGDTWTYFRRILYDSNLDEGYWIRKYEAHNKNVIEYFKEHKIDLLVIDLDTCQNINKKLNNFLGFDNKIKNEYGEDLTFPMLNKLKQNKKINQKIVL